MSTTLDNLILQKAEIEKAIEAERAKMPNDGGMTPSLLAKAAEAEQAREDAALNHPAPKPSPETDPAFSPPKPQPRKV